MTSRSFQPTAAQLAAGAAQSAKPAPALKPEVAEGVDMLHDALKAEFAKVPFTAQAQATLTRIDRVVVAIRGRRA